MVTPTFRTVAALLLAQIIFLAAPVRGELPDYKLGDVATEDIVTSVPLVVIDPEATEALQEKEARRIRFVVRHMPALNLQAGTELRATIGATRTNFLTQLRKNLKGRQPNESDIDTQPYRKTVRAVNSESPKDLPLALLAPMWVRGESDEPLVAGMLAPLTPLMARPIIAAKVAASLPRGERVRLVTVTNLDVAPPLNMAESGGISTNAGWLISLATARQFVATNFPAEQRGPGRFAASFLVTNACPDPELTAELRARRTEHLAVKVEFAAAQTILHKGQPVDRLALSVLAALREKSLIGTLQTKLEVAQTKSNIGQTIATQIDRQTRWIVGGFGILALALVVVIWRLRTRRLASLLPIATAGVAAGAEPKALPEGNDAWRDRALAAEVKAEQAQQAVRSGVLRWMRDKVVHGLFKQRSELLSTQQRAEADMRALEKRLEQLHAPLQDRIAAYEKRIVDLEKDLALKGVENIELLKAKISLARHQLSVERGRSDRFGEN